MSAHPDNPAGTHVSSPKQLLMVWGSLMALTALTVYTASIDFAGFDLAVAMVIATVKASLVALFFMHLRYDRPFNGFIFMVALGMLGLMLAFVMVDSYEYQPDIDAANQALRAAMGK
ncbi:MAG: hypothetical protein HOM34_09690 [Planctomycetes bacterium]|jgi:cytochrome c oxidase subunit 4|nr:hypothetical protein [Planctomycetota bacterium]MBT4029825.1 hypothetical protein [Planctomycetota bacterium]MBT4559919.1 hypothetical protein [Planctomycetota bacterium]MBT5101031.1 hypothetical protein [Planctomycetota bacterium]MBT5120979.1 hypothetical protein [Planctomycetota bacterium]